MSKKLKVFFWQWNSYMNEGVLAGFRELQAEVYSFFYPLQNWEEDETFLEKVSEELQKHPSDVVFSINFNPLLSQACQECQRIYVSWSYDAPLHIRNLETMNRSCNRIYLFDKGLVEEYRRLGYPVHHMLLAGDVEGFAPKLRVLSPEYRNEISMVGQLYPTEYAYYLSALEEQQKGYLQGLMAAAGKVTGAYLLSELLSEDLLKDLNRRYAKVSGGKVQLKMRELEYLLATELTARDRYLALQLLSGRFEVSLYSGDKDERLTKVKQKGMVNYSHEMPQVFAGSKINLNISLRGIRTGIPLRVMDVLSCGGFLISNPQAEIYENFRVGEEIVVYHDMEELVWLAEYYLKHDRERCGIAEAGRTRVKEDFRFARCLEKMLQGIS